MGPSQSSLLLALREDVASGRRPLRITTHAQVEAAKDGIYLSDLRAVFETGEVIEFYADRKRWLLHGLGVETGVPIHLVVEDTDEAGVVVTTYVPNLSLWLADKKRRSSKGKNQ